MSAIIHAMAAIHHLAARGDCRHAPAVVVRFKSGEDRFRFRQSLKADLSPIDAMEATKNAASDDEYQIHGIALNLTVEESR